MNTDGPDSRSLEMDDTLEEELNRKYTYCRLVSLFFHVD